MTAPGATTALPAIQEYVSALVSPSGTDPDTIESLKQLRTRRRHHYRVGAAGLLIAESPDLVIVRAHDWPVEAVPRPTSGTSSLGQLVVGSLGTLDVTPTTRTHLDPLRSLFVSHSYQTIFDELMSQENRMIASPHHGRRAVSTTLPEPTRLPIGENLTTLASTPSTVLKQRFALAFDSASEQRFEDGRSSDFSRTLLELIHSYGTAAVAEFERWVRGGKLNDEVLGEALRWLATSDHRESRKYRMLLLQECLRSPSPMIRDAAALGLALIDDPGAIPALEEAIDREHYPEVREGLQQVLDQLRDTARCPSF